jgi:transaldolase
VPSLDCLRIKIFADGASLEQMLALAGQPLIKGFTTNPSLMRRAGVKDYRTFAATVLAAISDRPVSFEVLADDLETMGRQAQEISRWGENVYVKVPITNTRGESSCPLIQRLAQAGVKVNVTGLMTVDQARRAADCLADTPAVLSLFAGRIADTGCDPVPVVRDVRALIAGRPQIELMWASPREVLNLFQADAAGCHIITMTHDLLGRLSRVGQDLADLSLETVRMFYDDACAAGYTL